MVRRRDRLLGVCVPWINDRVGLSVSALRDPCRPWSVDREPPSLRLEPKGKTLGDAGSSLLYFAHTHYLLVPSCGGSGGGKCHVCMSEENCRMVVFRGGGLCV